MSLRRLPVVMGLLTLLTAPAAAANPNPANVQAQVQVQGGQVMVRTVIVGGGGANINGQIIVGGGDGNVMFDNIRLYAADACAAGPTVGSGRAGQSGQECTADPAADEECQRQRQRLARDW